MRVIQLEVSSKNVEAAKQVLDGEDIDCVVFDTEGDEGDALLEFPIPRQAVEYVLTELHNAGVPIDDEYRVNLHANVANTRNLDDFVDRFVEDDDENDFIAHEELVARARDMNTSGFTYYAMTFLGVIVATSGLLLNSPAVVVGSMVVAPQLGAALKASVGIVANDAEMITTGFKAQFAGLGLGLVGSVAFATLLRSSNIVTPGLNIGTISQIGGRTSPGPLAIVVGVAAGAAAVISLASEDSPSGPLVGVMVSAALLPAAATAGLGIAWNIPHVALGATVLLIINVVTINTAGPVVLWLMGYRPDVWNDDPIVWEGRPLDSLGTMTQYRSSLTAILLLVSAMSVGGVVFTEQITYDQIAKSSVDDVLERPEYQRVTLKRVSVSNEFLSGGNDGPPRVDVAIGDREGASYPRLATEIQHEIMNDAGLPVTVVVTMDTRKRDMSRAGIERRATIESRGAQNGA